MTGTPTRQLVAAELIGTFVLVLLGCGSIAYAAETLPDVAESGGLFTTATTVGLTFGLTWTAMSYAVGSISGGHFNPAVSVGAALGGRLAWHQVPVYVASQLAGAILGAAVLFTLLHGFEGFTAEGAMGQNAFGSESPTDYALWAALLLELVLTLIFVWVFLAATDERHGLPVSAPLVTGFTLVAIHFLALSATGASVNPARSIGPALFAGGDAIAQVWLFVVAPLLGATIAGFSYVWLFGREDAEPAEHQWTPEQIAAWEAQQAQAAQQPWTPEQIAAWEAQQAAQQQPLQGWPTAPGDDDGGDAERTQIRPPR